MHKICLRSYKGTCCLTKLASDARLMSLNSENNGKTKSYVTNQDKDPRPVFVPEEVSLDDPPTTCCMSGCANCVYILWAEALSKKMASADPVIAQKILEKVEDPGMKAFLRMELRCLGMLK